MKKDRRTYHMLSAAAVGFLCACGLSVSFPSMAAGTGLKTLSGVPGDQYRDGESDRALFSSPSGFDVRDGEVYIADTGNNRIRRYTSRYVTTVAGTDGGSDIYGNPAGGFLDSTLGTSLFSEPSDCLLLPDGKLVISDRGNNRIRVAGKKWVTTLSGTGEEGYAEGKAGQAKYRSPGGLAAGADGMIYIADTGNHVIRAVGPDGVSRLIAGTPGSGGYLDGTAGEARFFEPTAVAVSDDGSIYVADSGNQRIRKIEDGLVTTVAGGGDETYLDTEYTAPGDADGKGGEARFCFPEGICMAGHTVIVADTGNHVIRAVSPDGTVTTIAGCKDPGYRDGDPLEAELHFPADVRWENGMLYIMDTGNSALRVMPFEPELQPEEPAGESEAGERQSQR